MLGREGEGRKIGEMDRGAYGCEAGDHIPVQKLSEEAIDYPVAYLPTWSGCLVEGGGMPTAKDIRRGPGRGGLRVQYPTQSRIYSLL
jgi:hypothetical protein